MKEELIRVLNNKLNDINSDINSLVEINKKIAEENENLSYVSNILDLFKDNDENNILNFSKLDKDDFDRVVDIIGENAKEVFNTDGCNYDGLVYLINGINSGISLELNEEQKNGINYLIEKLKHLSKENQYNIMEMASRILKRIQNYEVPLYDYRCGKGRQGSSCNPE